LLSDTSLMCTSASTLIWKTCATQLLLPSTPTITSTRQNDGLPLWTVATLVSYFECLRRAICCISHYILCYPQVYVNIFLSVCLFMRLLATSFKKSQMILISWYLPASKRLDLPSFTKLYGHGRKKIISHSTVQSPLRLFLMKRKRGTTVKCECYIYIQKQFQLLNDVQCFYWNFWIVLFACYLKTLHAEVMVLIVTLQCAFYL